MKHTFLFGSHLNIHPAETGTEDSRHFVGWINQRHDCAACHTLGPDIFLAQLCSPIQRELGQKGGARLSCLEADTRFLRVLFPTVGMDARTSFSNPLSDLHEDPPTLASVWAQGSQAPVLFPLQFRGDPFPGAFEWGQPLLGIPLIGNFSCPEHRLGHVHLAAFHYRLTLYLPLRFIRTWETEWWPGPWHFKTHPAHLRHFKFSPLCCLFGFSRSPEGLEIRAVIPFLQMWKPRPWHGKGGPQSYPEWQRKLWSQISLPN